MTYICVSKLYPNCYREWLVAHSATTHYLNQWWFIVNKTPRDIFRWNSVWNSKVFIQENAYENVVCKSWRQSCLGLNVLTNDESVQWRMHTARGLELIISSLDKRVYCWILWVWWVLIHHYYDVIMTTVASQITSLTVVYSIVYSGAD